MEARAVADAETQHTSSGGAGAGVGDSGQWMRDLGSILDADLTLTRENDASSSSRSSGAAPASRRRRRRGGRSAAAAVLDNDRRRSSSEGFLDAAKGFARSAAELLQKLGETSVEVLCQNFGEHYRAAADAVSVCSHKMSPYLEMLEFVLPEARNPTHVLAVLFFVFLLTVAVLRTGTKDDDMVVQIEEVSSPHVSADRIQLPDGRYIAYREEGMPAPVARHSILVVHSFLSSRLTGIPGINAALLEEFKVRLVTYDLPGYGESDPHPQRNLTSSAFDMKYIADALNLGEQFWVLGYSGGGIHVWAAIRYIPERLAGAALVAPMGNPYDPHMTKDEQRKIWENWTFGRKLSFILAKRAAYFLPSSYRRRYFKSIHNSVKAQALTLGKKDVALAEKDFFLDFQRRDTSESLRQGSVAPLVQETLIQVNNWGFSLAELRVRKKPLKRFTFWLHNLFRLKEEEWEGFHGPIHIWQGTDDRVVPYSFNSYAKRMIPGAILHRLNGEGHFSYFYFCDDCHREIFNSLFGNPDSAANEACTDVPIESASLQSEHQTNVETF